MSRFRTIFACAGLASAALTATALIYMAANDTALRLHLVIAVTLAITLSMFLAAGLMGLMFLSNESGHDQAAADEAARHEPGGWLQDGDRHP